MCGIVGILKYDPHQQVDKQRLTRMRDVLSHRGPDGRDVVIAGQVGLGHRRLAIIDPHGGRQPMANSRRNMWITYNGEIYNFRELREELISRGSVFTTNSDTEVILHAYEIFGEECVQHLRGMFAFAIWDQQRRKLFLARDRLGIKPLYYAVSGAELLFASEIKAILAADSIRPSFNKAVLPEFLANRFSAGAQTFFEGIHKLLPGRTLSWSLQEGIVEKRYWQLPVSCQDTGRSFRQHTDEVRMRLEQAVSSHLVSDVPVGLFLSGGIDSTGLAALMAPQMKEPLRSFSVGFDDNQFDELNYARIAAESVGAEHKEVIVSPAEFFSALPSLIWHEDEPIAFPSSVSLYFVANLAKQNGVKVVLSGEGADELFFGYNRYRVTAWNERLGQVYWKTLPDFLQGGMRRLAKSLPSSLRRYSDRSFLALSPGPRSLYFENFATFTAPMRQHLVQDTGLLESCDPYAVELQCYAENKSGGLESMAHSDIQTYLVELLMKQDQMSMAASVESRVPFLDHPLVEYAVNMPSKFKLRGWQTKAVLRAALRDVIPRAILNRPKMGFPTPLKRWLRGSFKQQMQDLLLHPRTLERGLFKAEYVQRLVSEHGSGIRDHSDRLWLLMNLEIWQRLFIEGESTTTVLGQTTSEKLLDAVA